MSGFVSPISTGSTAGLQCVSGVVRVTPTGLVGAIQGFITPPNGSAIRFRQVLGTPTGTPLATSVDGRFATLCGNFVVDGGQIVLNVTAVIPGTAPTPTPSGFPLQLDLRTLLLLLLILLLTQQGSGGIGLGSQNIGSLLSSLGLGGTNLLGLLQQAGQQR